MWKKNRPEAVSEPFVEDIFVKCVEIQLDYIIPLTFNTQKYYFFKNV